MTLSAEVSILLGLMAVLLPGSISLGRPDGQNTVPTSLLILFVLALCRNFLQSQNLRYLE